MEKGWGVCAMAVSRRFSWTLIPGLKRMLTWQKGDGAAVADIVGITGSVFINNKWVLAFLW